MRVLLISHRYPPDDNAGVEQYTAGLAAALASAGESVSVFTRSRFVGSRPTVSKQCGPSGICVYRLLAPPWEPTHFLREHEASEELFVRCLLETSPDVIHVSHMLGISPRVFSIAKRHGIPIVLSLLDMHFACELAHLRKVDGQSCAGPNGGLECAKTCFAFEGEMAGLRWSIRTAYFRKLLRLATIVLCPSEYTANYFRSFGRDSGRLIVEPLGIARSRWEAIPARPASDPENSGYPFRVALLGALTAHKGADLAVDAFRIARLPKVTVYATGPAYDTEYLGRLIGKADAIPGLRLHIYGGSDPGGFNTLPMGADCAVVPTLVPEPYSQVTREALVLGLPVLTTRVGAQAEAVRDGVNGFTFDPARPAELAALLQLLATDRGLLRTLQLGAGRCSFPTVDQHATRLRDIYLEAISLGSEDSVGASEALRELDTLHEMAIQAGFE